VSIVVESVARGRRAALLAAVCGLLAAVALGGALNGPGWLAPGKPVGRQAPSADRDAPPASTTTRVRAGGFEGLPLAYDAALDGSWPEGLVSWTGEPVVVRWVDTPAGRHLLLVTASDGYDDEGPQGYEWRLRSR
jgi:hypothetical protein